MKLRPVLRWMWGFCYDPQGHSSLIFPIPCVGLLIQWGVAPVNPEVKKIHDSLEHLQKSFRKFAADSEELASIKVVLLRRLGKDTEGISTSRVVDDALQELLRQSEERRSRSQSHSAVDLNMLGTDR